MVVLMGTLMGTLMVLMLGRGLASCLDLKWGQLKAYRKVWNLDIDSDLMMAVKQSEGMLKKDITSRIQGEGFGPEMYKIK